MRGCLTPYITKIHKIKIKLEVEKYKQLHRTSRRKQGVSGSEFQNLQIILSFPRDAYRPSHVHFIKSTLLKELRCKNFVSNLVKYLNKILTE